MKPRAFEVNWPDADVRKMLDRVAATALPYSPANSGWSFGCDVDFLRRLQQYWVSHYDVGAAQADLNRYPQFQVRIDAIDIHFVHVRGESPTPRPLLLTHGWPGSHYEFWNVIEPLAYPTRFGGTAKEAFDLIIPSLPGYGLSGKPQGLIGPRATARLWNRLMTEVLGYDSYRAQGGDWGSVVSSWLGIDHAEHVQALHLNMLPFLSQDRPADADEKAWMQAAGDAQQRMGAYARLQMTRPQSLALAATDNPLGQAAWIVERFHDWSDLRTRDFEQVFPLDDLLTNVMLYVMTDSFASALWFYAGFVEEGLPNLSRERCETPTAYAAFHDPLILAPPRSRAEKSYRITRWSSPPFGGHFAAMENPEFFVNDLRAWALDGDTPTRSGDG